MNEKLIHKRDEWPSGLKCYTENREDPGSNFIRYSAKLWKPTSLQGSQNQESNEVINNGLVRPHP